MNKSLDRKILSIPYIAWAAAFIIVPLIMILIYGLTDKNGAFTWDNIMAILKYENRSALWLSIKLSLISTIICLLIAFPLAMVLRNRNIKSGSFVILVFILPMWMNFLLRTLAWQTLLEKKGVINAILSALSLPNMRIINTPAAIILGMVYNFLPFMILPLYNIMSKIDNSIIEAARDLGAGKFQTIARIWIPLSVPGIISGITMVFVPALTSFVVSSLLGGGKILLIGNVIEQAFTRGDDWHGGAGLSLVMMIFILISMALISKYDKNGEGSAF